MSHIAVDLKVIEVDAPAAARAAGVEEDRVLGGLVRLWHRCWSKKTDIASRVALCGVFGPEQADQLFAALVEFGLLEARDDGDFRVKGADRYLRIQAGREKGGKAASGNLKRGKKSPAAPRLPPGSPPADAPADPRLLSGLSPSTEHRAPSTEEQHSAGQKPPAPPKPPKPVEPPDPRHAPLVKALCEATPGYKFKGGRDAAAVKALLTLGEPDEVVLRWRRAWGRTGFPEVRELPDLVSRWNHFATAGPVVASAPLEQHTKTGRLEL